MDDTTPVQKPFVQKSPTELLVLQTHSLSTLVDIQNIQKAQIAELKTQNERMIELLSSRSEESSSENLTHVKIENINMPFGALVGFMIKISLASIPAAIILAIIYALIVALFGGIFAGIFNSFGG